ncbi:hypothetical protein [Eudoraea sp.]|uniref:hypothetical protein n=1 Tax=Eudoraea sp. TaxID=1979955 RepID=UPI003C708401
MPTIPIRDIGMKGWVPDIVPQDLPLGALPRMLNCRFSNKALATLPNPAVDITPTENIQYAAPYYYEGANRMLLILDSEWRLYEDDDTFVDVTPLVWTASTYWYHVQQGETLILTNGVDVPFVLFSYTGSFETMPGWPAEYRCEVIESYKNFLVALRITKNAITQPSLIKWCQPVAPGDTVYDWDFTDPGNLAGENPYQQSGQGIRGGEVVGDSMYIYYDESSVRMNYVGGQFVMSFQGLFQDDGMVSPHASTHVEGSSYVFGFRDIYVHDGVRKNSLTDRRLSRWLIENVDYDFPIFTEFYPARNEVCFLFRVQSEGAADHMLVYNRLWDAFTLVETQDPGGAGLYKQIVMGPRLVTGTLRYVDVAADSPENYYSSYDSVSYSDVFATAVDSVFYAVRLVDGQAVVRSVSGVSELVNMDPRAFTEIFPRPFSVEQATLDFDEYIKSVGDTILYVNRLYPQVNSTGGKMTFRIGQRANPNAGIFWGDPVGFDPVEDYAVDLRETGRYLAVQIESLPGSAEFTLSGVDIELENVGGQ